ncbi:hypothetical protein GCM10018787_16010 [Streptomyces thermodiastaticus]|jgi:hypothetical protein|nr:hypothetical protein GCM10018787_16010 [Streptomyces thermodiastaticus]
MSAARSLRTSKTPAVTAVLRAVTSSRPEKITEVRTGRRGEQQRRGGRMEGQPGQHLPALCAERAAPAARIAGPDDDRDHREPAQHNPRVRRTEGSM